MINWVVIVVNVTTETKDLFSLYFDRFFLTFLVLHCVLHLNPEELLNLIIISPSTICFLFFTERHSLPEGREYRSVALFCILLFVVSVVVSFPKLRVDHTECLNEAYWGEGLTFEIQVSEKALRCLGQQTGTVVLLICLAHHLT